MVLVDNGRSTLASSPRNQEILSCIRCGACLNACPVYERVGGHAYESAYSGPIGALLGPHHLGTDQGNELPFASSLCGACNEVCPVEIDIAGMLRAQRGRYVETGGASPWERMGWWAWSQIIVAARLYRALAHLMRGSAARAGHARWGAAEARAWSLGREMPHTAERILRDAAEGRRRSSQSGGTMTSLLDRFEAELDPLLQGGDQVHGGLQALCFLDRCRARPSRDSARSWTCGAWSSRDAASSPSWSEN